MFKQKKYLSGIAMAMCILFVVSLIGCGKSEVVQDTKSAPKTVQTTEEKPPLYTISYTAPNYIAEKGSDTAVGKVITDKFNIDFDFQPYSGDWNEKANLMLAAGDYPELLWVQSNDIVFRYIKAGAAIALDELLDKHGSNFKELHKNEIPYWRLASDDGKLYKWEAGAPSMAEATSVQYDVGVRIDVLEAFGWPKLLTEDDYSSFLKEALKKFPETDGKKTIGMVVPFAEPWGAAGLASIMYEKGRFCSVSGNNGVLWDTDKNEFMDYVYNPYVKESYKMFYRLSKEGILDRECFTDKSDQVQNKLNAGSALSVYYCSWMLGTANATLIKNGHPERQYIMMPIKLSTQVKNGDKRKIRCETTRPFENIIMTKVCKDPERVVKLLDYASTEEGQILMGWGLEGRHYTVGKDGKRTPTEECLKGLVDVPDYTKKEGIDIFRFLGMTYGFDKNDQIIPMWGDPSSQIQSLNDRQKEVLGKYGYTAPSDFWFKNPDNEFELFQTGLISSTSLQADTQEGKIEQKAVQLRVNTVPKLVYAKSDEEFESIWTKLMEDYKKLEPQKFINKYNELYKQNMEKLEKYK